LVDAAFETGNLSLVLGDGAAGPLEPTEPALEAAAGGVEAGLQPELPP
jgi:hypothetical protein